ncbi:MAG: enoyl-CoA hydratase/isomerase family protein [Sphingomonadaceae bacterium]|nr:enoyl-CoA hydratase/isomerase family protein [Sphingomonadaceae bacterium]
MADEIRLDIARDGIAALTLARPEAGNAMSWSLIDAFSNACAAIAREPEVRAVLITAEGKHFCVGGDIRQFASEPDPSGFIGRLARRLHEGIELLAGIAAPVIVAVQGAAAGAGLSLVAGGDLVIAARSSNFSMAYAGIGLVADGGATWLLPRLIGLRRTQELAYAGRRLSAEDALDFGLVTRLADDDALHEEARALAARIATGPTFAFGRMKRLLGATFAADLPTQLEAEAAAIADAMATNDARGAIATFLERGTPRFEGK